tara:strand:+ start:356 stop:658 length:303 start_codon:yes stop_codon:yes gene_type:complete
MTKRKDKSNIIPFMDTAGKINFPGDEEQTETEAQLEAEQTADLRELELQKNPEAIISKLFEEGFEAGRREGYFQATNDALEILSRAIRELKKNRVENGND